MHEKLVNFEKLRGTEQLECHISIPAASSLPTHMSAPIGQSRPVGRLPHSPPEVTGILCWPEWQRLQPQEKTKMTGIKTKTLVLSLRSEYNLC